jgi:acyl carrier protein
VERTVQAKKKDISARVRTLLAARFEGAGNGNLNDPQTALLGRGIGLDSIEILELVAAVEEEFGFCIEDDELNAEAFRTVASLVDFIERRLPS